MYSLGENRESYTSAM